MSQERSYARNIVRGFGSLIDTTQNYHAGRYHVRLIRNDQRGLQEDWLAIGGDIQRAIHKNEHRLDDRRKTTSCK